MSAEPAPAPIVDLTAAARERALEAVKDAPVDGAVLRIGVRGGGCAGFNYVLAVDLPHDGDIGYSLGDLPVTVDPDAAPLLQGTLVDWVQQGLQGGFEFRNPNAVSSCGCGTSFRVDGDGCSEAADA